MQGNRLKQVVFVSGMDPPWQHVTIRTFRRDTASASLPDISLHIFRRSITSGSDTASLIFRASMAHPVGGCRAATPRPQSKIKRKNNFVDTIMSMYSRDLRCSLNQPLQSADDWQIWRLKKRIPKTYGMSGFFPISFNFPCNRTRCRLGDLTWFS
jgi:hypothetical protein